MQPSGKCPICKAEITYVILQHSGFNYGKCSKCGVFYSYTWLPEVVPMMRLNPNLVPEYERRDKV